MKRKVCLLGLLMLLVGANMGFAGDCGGTVLVYKGGGNFSAMFWSGDYYYEDGKYKAFLVVEGCFDVNGYFEDDATAFLVTYEQANGQNVGDVTRVNNNQIIYNTAGDRAAFFARNAADGGDPDINGYLGGKVGKKKVDDSGNQYYIPGKLAGAIVEIGGPGTDNQAGNLSLAYDRGRTVKANKSGYTDRPAAQTVCAILADTQIAAAFDCSFLP